MAGGDMRPCHVTTWGKPAKYFDAFMRSTFRNGLHPQNADAEIWPGTSWENIEWFRKTKAQANFVRENRGKYDVYLFTDSYDIICATGWEEILRKFEAYKSPIVFGAESYPWPKTEQAPLYPETPHRAKYLNAGLWIGTADAAEHFLNDIEQISAKREQCDQGICVDAFLSKRHPIVLDTSCSILFCTNVNSLDFLDVSGVRPKTTDTGEEPCFCHGNGNSSLQSILECLKL
jgi:hypothetical protein